MSSLVYALVGKTGHGKGSTASSLSASEHFLADDSLESVTSSVSALEQYKGLAWVSFVF